MGREKNGSLIYQFTRKLHELKAFGESRHEAKKIYKKYCEDNNIKYTQGKTLGIHSLNTADSYRESGVEFCKWLRENHKNIKRLDQITSEQAYEWLRMKERKGSSAYTISKDMSALNKVIRLELTKKEGNLTNRSYKNVTRSRESKAHDSKFNKRNYEHQILVAQAFGLRRESILGGQYQIKDVSMYKDAAGNVRVSVIEKGGKYREAPCLKSFENKIKELYPDLRTIPVNSDTYAFSKDQFKNVYNSSNKVLFDTYTSKIDNHAFRREYANKLYQEIYSGMNIVPGYLIEKYNDSGETNGYVNAICRAVSIALGHNRINVSIQHYLSSDNIIK